jgi:hypothetical protein
MAILEEKLISLLRDPESRKVLSTVGEDGIPHTVFKGSIAADSEGNIRLFELLETSVTNKNLTYSLWFKKPVSINVIGKDNTSYHIIGVPYRAIICGDEFEEAYTKLRERLGEGVDLSAIWIIKPECVKESSFRVRLQEHTEKYPLIGHLDRYVNEQIKFT